MKRIAQLLAIVALVPFSAFGQEETPVAKFLSSGNAYASMFFDYYYVLQGEDDYAGRGFYSRNKKDDNAFSFRRVYFGYDHTISEKFSGRVQLELTDRTTLGNGSRAFFLKDASLRWKEIYPLADLYIGHTASPVWSVAGAEAIWRYRSIDGTIADFRGLRSSSDSGLRLKGLFTRDGKFGYNLMVGNGVGTRAEDDKYKVTYLNLWTKLLDKRLYLEIFQDYNKADGGRHIATTKGLAAWETTNYTIAAEAVNQVRGGFANDGNDIAIQGLSVFAHANIIPQKLRAFGRFDSYNPDVYFSENHYAIDAVKPYDEMFFTFGLDFIPHKDVHIMPNIWINSYGNKMDGQITPETIVVARVTLSVTFKQK